MSDDNDRHAAKMAKKKAARDKIMATKTDQKGLVIVHTGKGKGKSSAAFGMRACELLTQLRSMLLLAGHVLNLCITVSLAVPHLGHWFLSWLAEARMAFHTALRRRGLEGRGLVFGRFC